MIWPRQVRSSEWIWTSHTYWIQNSFLPHSLPVGPVWHENGADSNCGNARASSGVDTVASPPRSAPFPYVLHVPTLAGYCSWKPPSAARVHVCTCFHIERCNGFFCSAAHPSYLAAVSLVSNSPPYQPDPSPLVSAHRSEVTCRLAASYQKIHSSPAAHMYMACDTVCDLCLRGCSGDSR